MPTGTRWRGTTTMVPGKEKWSYTASKVTVDLTWSGPYADLKAKKPSFGQELTTYESLFVTKVDTTELDGGAGRLDVTIEAQIDASSLSFAPLGTPTFELEFAELSKPLESHTRCGILKPDRGNNPTTQKKATWEDWAFLTTNDYEAGFSVSSGPWEGTEAWDLDTYRTMKERGEDSYTLYAPVLRRTTIHLYPPPDVGGASGKIQFPPASGFSEIGDWDWLAGPDRASRNARTYTRTSEWIGADYIDRNVYLLA